MKIKNKLALLLLSTLLSSASYAADNPSESAKTGDNFIGGYLSGQFARSNGDIDAAARYLKRVHQEKPGDAIVTGQLQGMLLLEGKVEDAVAIAAEIAPENRDPVSNLLLALHEIKNDHPDQAAALLDAASENTSAQLWMPLIGGWLDVARHKLTKPLTPEELSIDIGRAAPLVNYHLALINSHAGFVDAAATDFKNAIPDPSQPPLRVMNALMTFYDASHSPATLTPIVDSFRKAHPGLAPDPQDTAQTATIQGGVAEVLYTMGGVMLGVGVTNDAAIYLQLALYMRPDFPETALVLGDAYSELQQYGRANAAYASIPVDSALYGKAQLHIAVNYDRTGKLDEALTLLTAMSQQPSEAADALVTRADLLRLHERCGEAVESYSEALQQSGEPDINFWPVLFARSTCYEQLGDWASAQKDLRRALELKPDEPDVLNYLGYGLLEHGESAEEARGMIEKAVKARPNDPQIVDSMGWALYQLGDYKNAVGYLEKAVSLLPGDATVNEHLGDAYWQMGRRTEARFQWKRCLSFSPSAKQAENIEHKLKDGLAPPAS